MNVGSTVIVTVTVTVLREKGICALRCSYWIEGWHSGAAVLIGVDHLRSSSSSVVCHIPSFAQSAKLSAAVDGQTSRHEKR